METFISDISASENVIMVRFKRGIDLSEDLKKFTNHKSIYLEDLASTTHHDSAGIILCCEIPDEKYTNELLTHLFEMLKPGGKLMILNISERDKVKFSLIMKGFMNVQISDGIITANKPKFAMGSSAKLTVKAPSSVWKLDTAVDEDLETIDPDDLLDEDDLIKPDPTSLRVCKTTGKRKACKDCSCGLAEELNVAQNGEVIDTTDTPKSSCGSCYLGDAFRCSSCPYLGMPAFKPGEKIQLLGNQLQADV